MLRRHGSDRYTFKEIVVEEVYQKALSRLSFEVKTIIDLGANIGLASLYFLHAFPSAQLFAVEANPDTFKVLMANLDTQILGGRVRLLNAAVWHSYAQLAGQCALSDHHFSRFHVYESKQAVPARIEGIPMRAVLERAAFATIDLLKVDIEGGEAALFQRDQGWLRAVNSIAIEFHGDSRRESDFDSIIKEHGLSVIDDDGHTVLAVRNSLAS